MISKHKIEARSSRVATGGFLLVFLPMTVGLPYLALQEGNITQGVAALIWTLMGIPCFALLVGTFRPIVMFSADKRGITIGKGILNHRRRLIPWAKVTAVNEGTSPVIDYDPHRADRLINVESIVVEFSPSVDLGTSGFRGAYPDHNTYHIEPKNFGAGTDGADVILGLLEMKDRYTKR